jgi:hypothetical protein
MSLSVTWSVSTEKLFINGLGSYSNTGKLNGRKACLEGYIRAFKAYPESVGPKKKKAKLISGGFSALQIADLVKYAEACLKNERLSS